MNGNLCKDVALSVLPALGPPCGMDDYNLANWSWKVEGRYSWVFFNHF